jgi:metal-responsive CopG/Arc/MetJ family transcriptional regulator
MAMTKKIQFSFPERLFLEIDYEAKQEGISMAEFVRRAVEKYLGIRKKQKRQNREPLDEMAGFFEADKNLSEKHDMYLYGTKE